MSKYIVFAKVADLKISMNSGGQKYKIIENKSCEVFKHIGFWCSDSILIPLFDVTNKILRVFDLKIYMTSGAVKIKINENESYYISNHCFFGIPNPV